MAAASASHWVCVFFRFYWGRGTGLYWGTGCIAGAFSQSSCCPSDRSRGRRSSPPGPVAAVSCRGRSPASLAGIQPATSWSRAHRPMRESNRQPSASGARSSNGLSHQAGSVFSIILFTLSLWKLRRHASIEGRKGVCMWF